MLEDPSGRIEVENPVCGDILSLTWTLSPEGRIQRARFQVYGCPAAIAAGSVLTELIAGADTARLDSLGARDIDRALGGLGPQRYHAAVLAADAVSALRGAIALPPP